MAFVKDLHEIIEGLSAAFQFAKERTPTQEERISEALFVEYIKQNRLIFAENSHIAEHVIHCKRLAKIFIKTNGKNTTK